MGDTILMVKKEARLHLSKYQESYLRLVLYNLIIILPYLHSEFKGYQHFADITHVQWFTMFLWVCYLISSTTASFVDGTYGKDRNGTQSLPPKQEQTEIKV